MTTDQTNNRSSAGFSRSIERGSTSVQIIVGLEVGGLPLDDRLTVRIDGLLGTLHHRISEAITTINQVASRKGGFRHLKQSDKAESITIVNTLGTNGRSMTLAVTITPNVHIASPELVSAAKAILADLETSMHAVLDYEAVMNHAMAGFEEIATKIVIFTAYSFMSELGRLLPPLIKKYAPGDAR